MNKQATIKPFLKLLGGLRALAASGRGLSGRLCLGHLAVQLKMVLYQTRDQKTFAHRSFGRGANPFGHHPVS